MQKIQIRYLSLEFLYLFFLVLLLARSCVFTSNLDPRTNLFGFILYILPAILLVFKYNIRFNKHFWIVFSFLVVWTLLHILQDDIVKYLQYFNIFLAVFVSYIVIQTFKYKLIPYIEKIITILTAFSSFMWIIMHLVGKKAIESIGVFEPASVTSSASLLFFNTPAERYDELGLFGLMRNCGFSWEPGMFASIIVIGIVLNLLIYKNNFKNTNFYILVFGLFSTFSTTGYASFAILLIIRYIYYARSKAKFIFGIILIMPLVFTMLDIPFMQEKIQLQLEEREFSVYDEEAMKALESSDIEGQMTVNRFEGIELDFINFKRNPFIGYGNVDNSYTKTNISELISTSNGIMKEFAQMGFILALLHQICFITSCREINLYHKGNIKYLLYIIYFVVSISYSLGFTALMNSLMFFSYFKQKNDK